MPMERYTSTTSMPYYVYTHSFKELAVPGPLVRKKCAPAHGNDVVHQEVYHMTAPTSRLPATPAL
jgi:hypothetical protein